MSLWQATRNPSDIIRLTLNIITIFQSDFRQKLPVTFMLSSEIFTLNNFKSNIELKVEFRSRPQMKLGGCRSCEIIEFNFDNDRLSSKD